MDQSNSKAADAETGRAEMTDRVMVRAPLAGWLGNLSDVPDPVFAERMMGEGLAIDPVEGRLVAPCAGTIVLVPETGHSATLRTTAGAELLMHIGLETVALGGTGFHVHVAAGEAVAAGQLLISFDLDVVLEGAKSLVTPVVLTNGDDFELVCDTSGRRVAAGDAIGEIRALRQGAAAPDQGGELHRAEILLSLPHGIHARPAGRIAAAAKGFAADVQLGSHGRRANARSPVALMTLGARFGDMIEIVATGADGAEAVAELHSLIGQTLLEAEEQAVQPPQAAVQTAPAAVEAGRGIRGVCAVPGIAIGAAVRLDVQDREVPEEGEGAHREQAALDAAVARVSQRLAASAALPGDTRAAIAGAHLDMLADVEIGAASSALVREGRSAAFAWRTALRRSADDLRATANPLLQERVGDLLDLERQVIAELFCDAAAPAFAFPDDAILVARDILPSQFMALELARLGGICTGGGGPTSHVAIMAAAAGVPMLVAVGSAIDTLADGTTLLLDAAAGRLIVDPSEERTASARRAMETARQRRSSDMAAAAEPCRTRDGARIEVFANVASVADAEQAVRAGAEGCGLLRTEFLFLDRTEAPSEAEQHQSYQGIADALGNRPLIVRTLDIGGDKPIPYLLIPREENPALGLRGVRTSLWRPDLLDAQLRAILGVTPARRCRIMIPMVVSLAEIRAVRARLEAMAASMGITDLPELGIMIETPAAAVLADRLAEEADFFSVGSNDLTQYVLAMDRGNPAVAADVDGFHPAVLRMIDMTVRAAAQHGRTVGVCGGLASSPVGALLLIGLGVTELSATAASVAAVKAQIRAAALDECRDLARRCLDADSPDDVRALAAEQLTAVAERKDA